MGFFMSKNFHHQGPGEKMNGFEPFFIFHDSEPKKNFKKNKINFGGTNFLLYICRNKTQIL